MHCQDNFFYIYYLITHVMKKKHTHTHQKWNYTLVLVLLFYDFERLVTSHAAVDDGWLWMGDDYR